MWPELLQMPNAGQHDVMLDLTRGLLKELLMAGSKDTLSKLSDVKTERLDLFLGCGVEVDAQTTDQRARVGGAAELRVPPCLPVAKTKLKLEARRRSTPRHAVGVEKLSFYLNAVYYKVGGCDAAVKQLGRLAKKQGRGQY